MLQDLPSEITYKILFFLDNLDLIRCSETCRTWNAFINTKPLIRELELMSRNQLNSVMTAGEKGYLNCNQITSLSVRHLDLKKERSVVEIPTLFPEIKTFKTGKLYFSDNSHGPIIEKLYAHKKWQKTLEVLHIGCYSSEISTLLAACQFERLTELKVDFSVNEAINPNNNSFFGSLKYVPQLRVLRSNLKVPLLSNLDLLHGALPLLERLELYYVPEVSDIDRPENITLVDTLTHLSLRFTSKSTTDSYGFLFQVITQKYRSLTHLELSIDSQHSISLLFDDNRESEFLILVQLLSPTLKSFKIKLIYFTQTMIDALDHAITSKQLPELIELFICIHDNRRTDDAWLQCFSKDMFRSLKSLFLEIEDVAKLNAVIPYTTSLTELHIDGKGGHFTTVYLDSIFNLNPLLYELTIRSYYAGLGVRNNYLKTVLNVRDLTINMKSISDQIIPFIRRAMPNLKRLSITTGQVLIRKTSKLNYLNDKDQYLDFMFDQPICLPYHHLDTIYLNTFTGLYAKKSSLCSVKDSVGTNYYFYDGNTDKVKYGGADLTSVGLVEGEGYFYIHIECKSLHSLTLNDKKIF